MNLASFPRKPDLPKMENVTDTQKKLKHSRRGKNTRADSDRIVTTFPPQSLIDRQVLCCSKTSIDS